MVEEQKSREMVVTYTVSKDGPSDMMDVLNKHIAEGYKVVDLISTAATDNGAGCSFVSVTAFLKYDAKSDKSDYFYHKQAK